MTGYNPDFIGLHLPLPTFTAELLSELVNGGQVFDYPNYSIIMNGHPDKRSAAIVCLNINQNKFKTTDGRSWRTDGRIGNEYQLDNDYYFDNPWDRGHMARRATAAWGDSQSEARFRSQETYYYSNSSLQHKNLNQDEWLENLEEWVKDMEIAKDGLMTSMSGPFYGRYDRSIRPSGRRVAIIPSGFFKVVSFINKNTNKLDVRAFAIFQDEEAIANARGGELYNNQRYQVTITEIETLTGLKFDESIYHANPLFASKENADDRLNVNRVPERIEVARAEDVIDSSSVRETVIDDDIAIYISAAMVNPEGSDHNNEWVSLVNLGAVPIDITGWQISDNSDKRLKIDLLIRDVAQRVIEPGGAIVLKGIAPIRLSNQGDVIKLYNNDGERVDWVNYTKNMVSIAKPVVFLRPRDTLR